MTHLSIKEAQKILETFICTGSQTISSESEKVLIREALLLLTNSSDYQNLGICADDAAQGFVALETYLKALGYEAPLKQSNFTSFIGPVYIKFNTQRMSYYLDSYTGNYRGVLVSCQSLEDESVNGTYGHLPLDLFIT